ncbi:MAG: MBL fold metallo-hydrolase [Bacteroidales bacterium]|nr:MBL fold metallo-hydrolase [Bacteroidales bacterium]
MKRNLLFASFGLLCAYMLVGSLVLSSCTTKPASTTAEEDSLFPFTYVLDDGETTVTWIKDNQGHALRNASLFPDVTQEVIEELGLQDGIESTISCFLLHTDGKWALFDTGLGIGRGLLVSTLDSLGVPAENISVIYITHFHGDHIGGLVNEGRAVFPNAEIYASQREFDAWIKEMPRENTKLQQEAMVVYNEHLHLFQFGDTLVHGVVAIDAVGHTPGHTVFQKENLLVIGDLMHGAALQIPHPEYNASFDMDKEQSAASRVRILKYAKDNNLLMAGMHLPEPAFIKPEQAK